MHKQFIRLTSLGNDYSKEAICESILQNKIHPVKNESIYKRKGFDIEPYFKKYKTNNLTGLQNCICIININ